MNTIRGGIAADGVGAIVGGLIGSMGIASYSANVGLSIATGATSRRSAFFAGGIFILLAFFPKLAAIFAIMPRQQKHNFLEYHYKNYKKEGENTGFPAVSS